MASIDAGFSPGVHGMAHGGCGGTWRVHVESQAEQWVGRPPSTVLASLCPVGEPVEGVRIEQDWDSGVTKIVFRDGSRLRVSDIVELG